jgi:hypothetical protein
MTSWREYDDCCVCNFAGIVSLRSASALVTQNGQSAATTAVSRACCSEVDPGYETPSTVIAIASAAAPQWPTLLQQRVPWDLLFAFGDWYPPNVGMSLKKWDADPEITLTALK